MNDQVEQLIQAAFNNQTDQLIKLLATGIDINAKGRCWSALHAAIENENYDCVKILIENGADIEQINGNFTPFSHAVDISIDGTMQTGGGQGDEPTKIIMYLLQNGANPEPGLKVANDYQSKKIVQLIETYKESC